MFKNKVNYKRLGKLTAVLTIAATPLFTSCDKTENECNDPKLAQINALRTDSTRLAGEVRAAVEPAKTDPKNIAIYFDMLCASAAGKLFVELKEVKTLPDSTAMFKLVVETHRNSFAEVGEEPLNNVTTTDLYNKSNAYIVTIEELQKLYSR